MSSLPDIPLPPIFEPKSNAPLHRLPHAWAFWCQKKGKRREGASWYEGLTPLGRFNTLEGFWQVRLAPRRARAGGQAGCGDARSARRARASGACGRAGLRKDGGGPS
jgi:hypothetical protein